MNLRRAVSIAVLSATLLTVGLFAHLTHSSHASRTIDEISRLSNAITTSVAELDQLVYQFFLHPHVRPVQQWRLLSADMEGLFKALEEAAGTQSSVTRLRSGHLQARELFDALVAEVNDGALGASVVHQRRSRLAEQMLLVSRSLVNQAEVIHREFNALLLEHLHFADCFGNVGQHHTFGEFKRNACRIDLSRFQHIDNLLDKVCLLKLACADVHGNVQMIFARLLFPHF